MRMSELLLEKQYKNAPYPARLMGVDLGKKTIGLAVCDSQQMLATPLETIRRRKFVDDAAHMIRVINEYEITGIVFGYPLHMNGDRSGGCDRVDSFIDEMKKHLPQGLWIACLDERLSTVSVEGSVDGYVGKFKAKESGLTDKLAAQVILQGALDYLARCQS